MDLDLPSDTRPGGGESCELRCGGPFLHTHTHTHTHTQRERERERECVCVCVCVC